MFSGQHVSLPSYSHYGLSVSSGGCFACFGVFFVVFVCFVLFFCNAVGMRTAASFPFAVKTRELCLALAGRNSLMGQNDLWTVLSP